MSTIMQKVARIAMRYEELSRLMSDPEVVTDVNLVRLYAQEQADIEELNQSYQRALALEKEIAETTQLLEEETDADMMDLARSELKALEEEHAALDERMKVLLLPKDPNDDKNIIVEIRAGAGGDEAALFAGELFRMYTRYAESQRWKVEVMSSNSADVGGFKEIIFEVKGKGAFSRLKFESGVHRVQRVPATESQGRVHTSTATVIVMPEQADVDVQIDMNDVRIDVFRSSGHGGQSVNTTDSAVRVTHMPSGLVVSCQDGKSQLQNKLQAMTVLRARLFDLEQQKRNAELGAARKAQVGTGDRSEKIRTYNFPQSRVTDHRIGLTSYQIDSVMNGDLAEFIDALATTEQANKLADLEE